METTWSDLRRMALLGLDRSHDQADGDLLSETAMLQGIARAALHRRAGWQADRTEQPSPPADVTPDEPHPWVGEAASKLLAALLKGRQSVLLTEWLKLAAQHQQVARPRSLPSLLSFAQQTSLPESLLLGSIGSRGRWLAAQHPSWSALLPADEQEWATGSKQIRLRILRQIRRKRPSETLDWIGSLITADDFRELVPLLPALQTGLETRDLPWLNPLGTHRRQEVRRAVLPLLAQLPTSELVQQARQQGKDWLQWQGEALAISLPDAAALTWMQDYQPYPTDQKGWMQGLGPGARSLVKALSLIPPADWETQLGKDPTSLLRLLPYHAWGMALLRGWLLAAINHQDASWGQAILRLLLYPKHDPGRRGEPGYEVWLPADLRGPLVSLVPPEVRQSLFRAALPYLSPELAPMAGYLLVESPESVAPDVAHAFANHLWQILQTGSRQLPSSWRNFLQDMQAIAYVMPVNSYPYFQQVWAMNPNYPQWYAPYLEAVLRILAFRQRLHASFR